MIFNFNSFFNWTYRSHSTQKTEKGARGTNENVDTDFNNSKQTNKYTYTQTYVIHTNILGYIKLNDDVS